MGSTIAYNVNVAFLSPPNYFVELVCEPEKRTVHIALSSHLFSRGTIALFPCFSSSGFGYFQKSNASTKTEDNRYHPQDSYYVLSTVQHEFSHESLTK